ncbi:MAG TPA: MFS transporter [Gemmataceae bacterium]|jgi:MFS family permease
MPQTDDPARPAPPPVTPAVSPAAAGRVGWAALGDLTRYQWFVFAVAAIAWMADCMDQQLFSLARVGAMKDLTGGDAKSVTTYATVSTSVFLIGWAAGGLVFGMFGDRLGRVRTLTLTILLYSIFTGLSAASVGVVDFCAYRFLTGLGVGGVFSAAVALLAETMPAAARPYTLGLMQALSAVGNCTAALVFIALGLLQLNGYLEPLKPLNAWRLMFLVGIVPAALVIFIQRRLEEPASWRQARDAAAAGTGKRLGSYADLFGEGWIRRHALLGMVLSFAGVVGLWGIGFFSYDLQQTILPPTLHGEADQLGLTGELRSHYIAGQTIIWTGITSLMLNIGAFFGMSAFSTITQWLGRRPTFAIFFLLSGLTTGGLFMFMRTRADILWMTPLMGFCLLSLFGGYAIYLPELFPTRLRSTGTSFCYNVGRFVAASGPLALGYLTNSVFAKEKGFAEPHRYAGVAMCAVFLLGIAVLPFLPETKGRPLPE